MIYTILRGLIYNFVLPAWAMAISILEGDFTLWL